MSSSISSPRLAPVPAVSPAAPVSPEKAVPPPPATDLLLITSATDFPDTVELLRKEAGAAGIRLDTILIEDLDGSNPGEKLTSLHRLMGESVASGKMQPATVTYVALHGHADTSTDLDDYVDGRPHLQDFARSLWKEDSASAATAGDAGASSLWQAGTADGDSGTDEDSWFEPDTEGFIHMMSACKDALTFPSILLLEAIRHSTLTPGGFRPDYRGTIFIGSCEAGGMNEQLVVNGSDYVVLNGKKTGEASDADDCMREVIGMMAERRQQQLPAFSGRDYWMRLRNVSGEHIAYVGQNQVEISKVLAYGCSEPVLVSRNSQAGGQPLRILAAKLAHGSPESVQAVFDKYGAELLPELKAMDCFSSLAMDVYRSSSMLEEKIDILEGYGLRVPDDPDAMAELLEGAISFNNHELLKVLLARGGGDEVSPALLPFARACLSEETDVAKKLQALCEGEPYLQRLVGNLLAACVDAHKSIGPTAQFDVSAVPYFGMLLMASLLQRWPPALGQPFRTYYPQVNKPALRSEIMNTLAWKEVYDVWNLAKRLVYEFKGSRAEMESVTNSLRYLPRKETQ